MKGVILAGGIGSRLHPLTRITNKHLLPIYDRPMVTYAIEAIVSAGVTEIMVVTGGTHAGEFLRLLGDGHAHGIDRLSYAYQEREGGIAEALGLAERFAGGDPVVVMLADNVFEHSIRPPSRTSSSRRAARGSSSSRPRTRSTFGTSASPSSTATASSRIHEKPEYPPSDLAVTGLYFYDASVFEVVPTLEPSARGELEITDVNNWFIEQGSMEYDVVDGLLGRRRRVDRRLLRRQRLRAAERREPLIERLAGSRCSASRTSVAGSSRSIARAGPSSRCARPTSRSRGRA